MVYGFAPEAKNLCVWGREGNLELGKAADRVNAVAVLSL